MEIVIFVIALVFFLIQSINKANKSASKANKSQPQVKRQPSAMDEFMKALAEAQNQGQGNVVQTALPEAKSQLDTFLAGRHFYDQDKVATESGFKEDKFSDQSAIDYDQAALDYDQAGLDLDKGLFAEEKFQHHVLGDHPASSLRPVVSTNSSFSNIKNNQYSDLFRDKKQLRNAFIMSEILAKPKSKR